MDEIELLELAAEAYHKHNQSFWGPDAVHYRQGFMSNWNPLTDTCHAFRLAVSLGINLNLSGATLASPYVTSEIDPRYDVHGNSHFTDEVLDGDLEAAARRVIVRAAAEIGARSEITS